MRLGFPDTGASDCGHGVVRLRRENAPSKRFVTLSGLWSAFKSDNANLPFQGVATYQLTVRIPPDRGGWALMVSRPLSVARVWVNGRLIEQIGAVGMDKALEFPKHHLMLGVFSTVGDPTNAAKRPYLVTGFASRTNSSASTPIRSSSTSPASPGLYFEQIAVELSFIPCGTTMVTSPPLCM